MRLVPVALLFPWLLFEPLFHPMRFEKAVIGMLAAFAAMALVPLASGVPKLRVGLSVVGALLALSNFFFPDRLSVMTSHVAGGALLLIMGAAYRPVTTYSHQGTTTSGANALLHQPQSDPA